jgi:hypothetical protein
MLSFYTVECKFDGNDIIEPPDFIRLSLSSTADGICVVGGYIEGTQLTDQAPFIIER